MVRLRVHSKPFNEHTKIDKFLMIPKKLWGDFETGLIVVQINGKKIKTRVYDIYCECIGKQHTHRILDLREAWKELGLQDNLEVEIKK